MQIETVYTFWENTGRIEISRKVVGSSDDSAQVEIDEFLTSCWGTTEYPEDLSGCTLSVIGKDGERSDLSYDYRCREFKMDNVEKAEAVIPMVQTKVCLTPDNDDCTGYYEEGYSFAPNLKIGVYKKIGLNEALVTTMKLEQAEEK